MDTLIEILQRIPDRRFGSVVHVGAGAHALDGIATLDAERVVLIEGDPEIAALLRADMPGVRQGPALQLVEQAVAAVPGLLAWHRYNLRRLNGPLDAGGLQTWYPRLRETETLQREAQPLGTALEALDLPQTDGEARPHVLVMDVPGQEASLLATLDSAWLQRFTWIVLRGCAQQPPAGWRPAREAAQRLAAWSFVCVDGGNGDDTLWPTTVHRFDRERFARLQLTVEFAELQTRADADAQRVLALQAAHDELDRQLAAARADGERLRADADRQRAEADSRLAAALAEADARVDAWAQQVRQAHIEHETATAALQALQQQVQDAAAATAAARAEADARVDAVTQQARQAQIAHEAATAALRQACDDATQRAAGLDAALRKSAEAGDELHQLAHALTAQAESLTRERDGLAASLAALESRCAALELDRDAAARAAADTASQQAALQAELLAARRSLEQARAEAASERDQLAQQLVVLQQERDTAVQAASDAATRHAALQAELLAAQRSLEQARAAAASEREASAQQLHAQVELARQEAGARLAALTAERDGLQQQLAALGKDRDEHAHWHRENTQWAHKLKAELDQVRAELAQKQQAAEANGRRAEALEQERDRLQQQIGERDARQHLLDAEVLKAGAQLDLIKDILIREKNF